MAALIGAAGFGGTWPPRRPRDDVRIPLETGDPARPLSAHPLLA
jgi:hypothetical protein